MSDIFVKMTKKKKKSFGEGLANKSIFAVPQCEREFCAWLHAV